MAQDQEAQGSITPAGDVLPSDAIPIAEGGTPTKPRSGFQRQKLKIAALERRAQQAEDDLDRLLGDYQKLECDYALESAYGEVCHLNSELAAQVQRLKSQRPAPVTYGVNLMGV